MDKEAIRSELKEVRVKIKTLKSDFSKKKNEKEDHFKKGEEFSKEIDVLYEEVKKFEKEQGLDKINEELDSKKKDLDEYTGKVSEHEKKLDAALKAFRDKKKQVSKKVPKEKLEKEIKSLETKLQTQVLSLGEESDISRRIQENRDALDIQSGGSGSSLEIKKLKKELNGFRRKMINSEKRIRSLYKQIRLISKEKKKKYKLIDDLRDSKKEAFDTFKTHKKSYSDLGKELKDLFKKEEELLEQLGESSAQKKKQSDKNIKAKQKEVEAKLMEKGGTLTTEDLLMLQRK